MFKRKATLLLWMSTLENSWRLSIHDANWSYLYRHNTKWLDLHRCHVIQTHYTHLKLLTDGGVASNEQKWDFGMIRECLGNKEKTKYNK